MSRGKLRAIKKKVEATKNLMKITRAMEMVARAKVRKFEREFNKFKAYMKELEEIKEKLPLSSAESSLITGGEGTLILVIAADMGLCGAFNTEINRTAEETAEKIDDFKGFIGVGYRATSYLRKTKKLLKAYEKLYDMPNMEVASEIADHIVSMVKSGEVGKVKVVYGKLINALIQRPRVEDLIPVKVGKGDENVELEPTIEKMVDPFLYFYISSKILGYMFETKVSEYYARQNAMKNATDNASEMIRTLTLEYNKARQASITQEIIEIVNGAEALKEIEEAG